MNAPERFEFGSNGHNQTQITNRLFQSFFLGGFECSTHRLRNGRRLDLLASSQHERFALRDYRRLREQGIRAARSGLAWHRIETSDGRYDFSSVLPQVRAARETGVQVIWDLCHFGWPDDIDIFKPAFVKRLAGLAGAFAGLLRDETNQPAFIVPVNEISFWAWAGGDVAYLNPFRQGRGFELKIQLARAAIEAMEAIWAVLPGTRFIHAEPVIHIAAHPDHPEDYDIVEGHRQAQYQTWDILAGRLWPQVGGADKYLDIVGVNYYENNQWLHGGPPMNRHDPLYRPFRELLSEVYHRYHRPVFVAETGTEGNNRPAWLRYMCDEVLAAARYDVPVGGICWYPILNHPGWDDDRHCPNGLWDYADDEGNREIYQPLAEELRRQQQVFEPAPAKDTHSNGDLQNVTVEKRDEGMSDLIVFSHLRWDFVWQRPQHLLSRLAKHYRVLFVEEPISTENETHPRLEIFTRPLPGGAHINVVRLVQPTAFTRWIGHGDPEAQDNYTALLLNYLYAHNYVNPILWMYTPMASEFADTIPHRLLICDVMDQLSAFKGAPAELEVREPALLRKADLVFTGGVSLYRSKLPYNSNTHLFPSGVEVEHFARATRRNAFERPADMEHIEAPVIGYFGVIDERMDLDLLQYVAQSHPEWNLVLIGPVVKIDPTALPIAPNVHCLGMKSYQQLPAYLAHFDVALVPFAMNEATFFLSPTKTLEYMAAHKPIVATPIQDVIELYGDVVHVGYTPAEFVAQIEAALTEPASLRRLKEDKLLAQHTWDSIAGNMHRLISRELARNQLATGRLPRKVSTAQLPFLFD
ncbi:MAG: glycosyltransferase [Chloroflexi bacterium]|nr:glycosyltransferase [Chloroflexota bacterium]